MIVAQNGRERAKLPVRLISLPGWGKFPCRIGSPMRLERHANCAMREGHLRVFSAGRAGAQATRDEGEIRGRGSIALF